MLCSRSTRLVILVAIFAAACGDDDAPARGAASPSAPVFDPNTVPSPSVVREAAPTSSVRTPAPSAATGCPATDATNVALPGTVHDRDVRGSETWTLAGSPHRLPEGTSIASGATLTIEPCVRVIAGDAQWVSVEAGGTLVAVGQPDRPILFDSNARTEVRGLWNGISFANDARPTSKLYHVVIEEAGGDNDAPAAIHTYDDFVLDVAHVRIVRAKRHGVRLGGSSRFAATATDLVVSASGIAEDLSVPVYFTQANCVGSLPDGRYDGNVTNEIVVEGAEVGATATWRNPGVGVRYRLLDGLDVGGPTGAILTIAPGTTLAFAAGKTLFVGMNADAALVLDGGADATRIVLTSARPVPDAGDWAGIHFGEHTSRAATKLSFVTIAFAGGTDVFDEVGCGDPAPAAITISNRDLGPRIDHVTFQTLDPSSIAIARNFSADEATDYTGAALGIDFGGGQRCKQSLNRSADGNCPDPIPACR